MSDLKLTATEKVRSFLLSMMSFVSVLRVSLALHDF